LHAGKQLNIGIDFDLFNIKQIFAVPSLSPASSVQGHSQNFGLTKRVYISRDALISIDVIWKEKNTQNVKLYIYGPMRQEIQCENLGLRTKCKTQNLKYGNYTVLLQFDNPSNIILIKNPIRKLLRYRLCACTNNKQLQLQK
jgi:hypothetical protein